MINNFRSVYEDNSKRVTIDSLMRIVEQLYENEKYKIVGTTWQHHPLPISMQFPNNALFTFFTILYYSAPNPLFV